MNLHRKFIRAEKEFTALQRNVSFLDERIVTRVDQLKEAYAEVFRLKETYDKFAPILSSAENDPSFAERYLDDRITEILTLLEEVNGSFKKQA